MPKKYSPEFRERAVRLLSDRLSEDSSCSTWQAASQNRGEVGYQHRGHCGVGGNSG